VVVPVTHARVHAQQRTHTHTHAETHMHTHTHTDTRAHTHTQHTHAEAHRHQPTAAPGTHRVRLACVSRSRRAMWCGPSCSSTACMTTYIAGWPATTPTTCSSHGTCAPCTCAWWWSAHRGVEQSRSGGVPAVHARFPPQPRACPRPQHTPSCGCAVPLRRPRPCASKQPSTVVRSSQGPHGPNGQTHHGEV
jgi:hypothetical protein